MTTVFEEKDVIEFEQNIGGKLPKNYRDAVLQNIGSSCEILGDLWYMYPIFNLGHCDACESEIKGVIERTEHWSVITSYPKNALTIAEDISGNYIVIHPGYDKYFLWILGEFVTIPLEANLEFVPINNQA